MTKSNGIASLKQAAKLLNKHAPDGESLAYINPTEARILKAHGGSGIMTLSGVPSYEWWNPFSWNWTGDDGIIDKAGEFLGYGDQTVLDKSGKAVQVAGRSPFQDAISIYAALRAKKDQEGLNAAEQSEFNRLNQQLTAGREEFKGYTGGGEHLTAPTNVPETIEDVSVFKETTGRPDMITTGQAQGGRIGYNEGGGKTYKNWLDYRLQQIAKGLLPVPFKEWKKGEIEMAQGGRIGYNLGGIDTPFQGIGALNPRMGYNVGSSDIPGIPGIGKAMRDQNYLADQNWETKNWEREEPFLPLDKTKSTETINWDKEPPYAIDMKQEDVSTIGGNQIQETVVTLVNSGIVGDIQEALEHAHILNEFEINSPGVTKLALSLINSHIVGDVREAIEQALKIIQASQVEQRAHGGRIGYDEGTHPLDAEAIAIFGNPYNSLNAWQQTVVNNSKAQGGRIGAQSGGIMPLLDMGGMEKDYRQDGGFVPIGRKEKADDVPARLSKNEFVFTADAVKAAGGGDIDQGAQRMYNVMKNLEAGGEISEQSQGQA